MFPQGGRIESSLCVKSDSVEFVELFFFFLNPTYRKGKPGLSGNESHISKTQYIMSSAVCELAIVRSLFITE